MSAVVAVLEHIEHFRARVLQDALAEATSRHWRRRAEQLEWAMARPGDYTGQATQADRHARAVRLAAQAQACRARAAVALVQDEEHATPAPARIMCPICGTPTSPWSCSCGATRTDGAG